MSEKVLPQAVLDHIQNNGVEDTIKGDSKEHIGPTFPGFEAASFILWIENGDSTRVFQELFQLLPNPTLEDLRNISLMNRHVFNKDYKSRTMLTFSHMKLLSAYILTLVKKEPRLLENS